MKALYVLLQSRLARGGPLLGRRPPCSATTGGSRWLTCTSFIASDSLDVYIGPPSKWGNPFEIGRDGTRAEVIARYDRWPRDQPELLADLDELAGKTLGCWCAPRACHGDVLARLASELAAHG